MPVRPPLKFRGEPVTISSVQNHPAPTPSRPQEYCLFFIPRRLVPELDHFFAGLDEPEEHFILVPAMRIDQLAWQPARIKRADVRALTNHDTGVWVALSKPSHADQLRAILDGHRSD
jgi:hypothetical protein